MNWLIAITLVLIGVAILAGIAATSYQTAYAGDLLAGLRKQNADLRCEHFGPEGPAAEGNWHRVISAEDQKIVWPGNGVLLGLRQVTMLQDERGRHWRVIVAHEKGKAPLFEAKELSSES